MSRIAVSDRVGIDVTYPSDIDGLELWLRAGSIDDVAEGGAVDYWNDDSQLGIACTGTTTTRPTWHTNEINGHPVVRFDGTDDFMISTSPHAHTLSHSFVVFKFTGGTTFTGYEGILTGRNGILNDSRVGAGAGSGTELYTSDLNVAGGGFVHIDGATSHDPDLVDLTTWHILSVHDENATVFAGANLGYQLGHDRANVARFCACDIAEVISYEDELSAANELLVVTYLNNKYDIF
jgi:hypothetical protein